MKKLLIVFIIITSPSFLFAREPNGLEPFRTNENSSGFVSASVAKANEYKKLSWFEKQTMLLKAEEQKERCCRGNFW